MLSIDVLIKRLIIDVFENCVYRYHFGVRPTAVPHWGDLFRHRGHLNFIKKYITILLNRELPPHFKNLIHAAECRRVRSRLQFALNELLPLPYYVAGTTVIIPRERFRISWDTQ